MVELFWGVFFLSFIPDSRELRGGAFSSHGQFLSPIAVGEYFFLNEYKYYLYHILLLMYTGVTQYIEGQDN